MGLSGVKGEMGVFMAPVTWDEHFQALRESVAETFKRDTGHPVAFHLLDLLMDVAFLFPALMKEEETRSEFLNPEDGSFFSLIYRPPVAWDWETGRPILSPETDEIKKGGAPATLEEATTLSAISKGLAWSIKEGRKRPVLFHGLQGLTPFPLEAPPTSGKAARVRFGFQDLDLATKIFKGLDRPLEEMATSIDTHGPILPLGVCIGGGSPLSVSYGFPFDEDILNMLGANLEIWKGLRFKGEIQGRPWESHFFLTCRGLEVDEGEKVARFILDITPAWGSRVEELPAADAPQWKDYSLNALAAMTARDALVEEAVAMRAAALDWGPEDWLSWREIVTGVIAEAMDRLIEEPPPMTAPDMEWTTTISAPVVSSYSMEVVETRPLRPTSWVSLESRVSHLAQTQLKHLMNGNVKRLPNLWKLEEERLEEGLRTQEETGTKPDWIKPSRGRGGGWDLEKKEKAKLRGTLLEARDGFLELDEGGNIRWVLGVPLEGGKVRELRVGGKGLAFLNKKNLKDMQAAYHKEEVELEKEVEALVDERDRTLFKPDTEENLAKTRKRLATVRTAQSSITSWKMAMDLLKHLVDEVAGQPRNPIEVEAQTIKDWMWPGKVAPDNWLQCVSETLSLLFGLDASVVEEGGKLEGGSFISVRTQQKDAPGQDLEDKDLKGTKGSSLVYIVLINRALLGGIAHLKTGTRTLTSGVEAETFEAGKLTPDMAKAVKKSGDRFSYGLTHLAVILKALGYNEVEIALAEHLEAFTTKADGAMAGKWTTRPKGGKYEDGDINRHYTSAFGECPFLPSPESGSFLHGALGTFSKSPEEGWDMAGRPTPSKHKGGLLHHMGIHYPAGPDKAGRHAALLRGIHALRRVVVGLGGGVLALRMSQGGEWYDLGEDMEEPILLHLLQHGKVFPFLAPGWRVRARDAYQRQEGVVFPDGIKEADRNRWTTERLTPENTLDGIPLHVQLEATIKKRGITQGQAAGELGVSAMTVSRWIREAKPISLESSTKIKAWIKGE